MRKLIINFHHCYGIKKIEKEFDFSQCNIFAIYAPNGAMKTSFANTFRDLSIGVSSSDLMFPERTTTREIKDENGIEIGKDKVFVIEPYNENYYSNKISTLLVNKELKEKYDEIHLKINEKKSELFIQIKQSSGLKNIEEVEEEFSDAITHDKKKIYEALERIEKETLDESEPELAEIVYAEIFNEKVLQFLSTKDFKDKILEYINKYNELIESSTYFKKGIFNHNNATIIAKSLTDNGFFKAKHSVSLNSKGGKKEITTKEELEEIIEQEKQTILKNPELTKAFNEIDDKLNKNKELKNFRDYLVSNMKVLHRLANLPSLRQDLWISYFKLQKELYKNILEEYHLGKERIKKIIIQAKKEETGWRKVVDIFNKRFSVPFIVKVKNQDDVILKHDMPSIGFIFKDSDGEKSVEKSDLLRALSSGEKRALYILNIIFEVEARKTSKQETIFVVDDIADSFDYKNKYAIIEYLKDITNEKYFYQIILTHNFDFFRTISSRLVGREQCNMIIKTKDKIDLIGAEYLMPFNYFKDNLHKDNKILMASIPFARNIVEYTTDCNNDKYKKLTSLLHIKDDSDSITISDLESIYKGIFPNINLNLRDKSKKVMELIYEIAEQICQDSEESINLENKIVLSIAIRLKAEIYMISKINDSSKVSIITKNQTVELLKMYKEKMSEEDNNIELLEQVNLMTPENIHFNSFMYEPILDMSDEHLKQLYKGITQEISS